MYSPEPLISLSSKLALQAFGTMFWKRLLHRQMHTPLTISHINHSVIQTGTSGRKRKAAGSAESATTSIHRKRKAGRASATANLPTTIVKHVGIERSQVNAPPTITSQFI